MSITDTRSLQQIKRDTEQTRAGLSDTVEQLKTIVERQRVIVTCPGTQFSVDLLESFERTQDRDGLGRSAEHAIGATRFFMTRDNFTLELNRHRGH